MGLPLKNSLQIKASPPKNFILFYSTPKKMQWPNIKITFRQNYRMSANIYELLHHLCGRPILNPSLTR